MTPEERYQAKLHKKQLDEKYLQKQLLKLNEIRNTDSYQNIQTKTQTQV